MAKQGVWVPGAAIEFIKERPAAFARRIHHGIRLRRQG
jgi:hypothetical protein